MVLTQEEVEAFGVQVRKPAETPAVGAGDTADGCREQLARCYVGRKTEIRNGVFAGYSCGVEKTEVELAVEGENVLHACIDCGV